MVDLVAMGPSTRVRAVGFTELVEHYQYLPASVLISQIAEGGSNDPLDIVPLPAERGI